MKILIAVPSKNRWRDNQIQRKTLAWLQYTKYDYAIFVEPQDLQNYVNNIPQNMEIRHQTFVNIKENNKGMGYCKLMIQKYAQENKYDYIFKADDDIIGWRDPANRGLGHNAPKRSKEYRCKEIFDPMIDKSLEMFKELGEYVGGVTLQYGNEMRDYDPEKPWIGINKRLQCCYIVRTDLLCQRDVEHFSLFEDFMTFVHLIKSGYKTITYGLTGIEYDGIANREGGFQDVERIKGSLHTMIMAKKIYPDLIWKKVNKPWKFEPDFAKTKFIERIKI